MIKRVFIAICLIFSVTSSFALQKIYIFHINGVNTTEAEARRNRAELNAAINAQSNMISNNGQVDLLYNSNGSGGSCPLCTQVADVFSQKKYENVTVDDYVMAYIITNKLPITPGSPEYITLKASIKDKYFADPAFMGNNFGDILNEFHQKTSVGLNTKYLTEYLKAGSSNGGKPYVLLIPHSQGNLYANNLYKKLTGDEGYNPGNLSIYGIASPAANNLGDYISKTAYNNPGYITSTNDGIINSLRVLAAVPPQQTIAAANINIPGNTADISGHSLIPIYLSDPTSRQQIATNTYNILHYFWMSNIYGNFAQTITGGNRVLDPSVKFVATQSPASTLSIAGIMSRGSCTGAPYFVVRDGTYDYEIGVGTQCVGTSGGTYNLTAPDYYDTNSIRIKIAGGAINQKSLSNRLIPPPHWCMNELSFNALSGGYYSGVIGGSSADHSCEKSGYGHMIPPDWPKKAELFGGVVGNLQV